jgi:hypothetical protein
VWLIGRTRQTFAMAGLILSAALAYLAISDPRYLIAAVLVYGLTKVGIHTIPWRR